MHPNPVFHTATEAENLAYARDRAFGVLAVAAPAGPPMLSHVPFLLSDDGRAAEMHLVRSNPIARALDTSLPARIAVSGPDSYISPDWYGIADQVPTWNYVAVHLTGTLELRPAEELEDLLARQSAFYEDRLAPKPPWSPDKLDSETGERLRRMIVPCRLSVETVDGTWKLGQNKAADARARAAGHVAAQGFGSEFAILAGLMRGADG